LLLLLLFLRWKCVECVEIRISGCVMRESANAIYSGSRIGAASRGPLPRTALRPTHLACEIAQKSDTGTWAPFAPTGRNATPCCNLLHSCAKMLLVDRVLMPQTWSTSCGTG
jgi:hypothetical protein